MNLSVSVECTSHRTAVNLSPANWMLQPRLSVYILAAAIMRKYALGPGGDLTTLESVGRRVVLAAAGSLVSHRTLRRG